MLNILLPTMYQNNYFSQPHPVLYQPLEDPLLSTKTSTAKPPPTSGGNNIISSMDQVLNESPLAINSTTQVPQASPSMDSTLTTPRLVDRTSGHVSERILEFRPVHKKQTIRQRFASKYVYPKMNNGKQSKIFFVRFGRHKTGPRDIEIHRFNNTILSGVDLRIFTYYWRIEHFSQKLKTNITHINSPIFTISGLHLRVKATLNHMSRDYLYLQLEPVANGMMSDQMNVVLQTGDVFQGIETKVLFKHKIIILDQVSGHMNSQIIRQIIP